MLVHPFSSERAKYHKIGCEPYCLQEIYKDVSPAGARSLTKVRDKG